MLILFREYLVMIAFLLAFGIAGMYSLMTAKLVPGCSLEIISATSIIFGYVWGWKVGLAYGIIFGVAGYIKISFLKLTTIVNALFMGLCGVCGALFATMGFGYHITFILSFSIRALIGFPTFQVINPGLGQNVLHSFGDAIFNIFITMQIFYPIYSLIMILA